MTRLRTRDAVVRDLNERLNAQRATLTRYRRALFELPRREQDAVTLAHAERRLDEAIDQLRRWQVCQPAGWRNQPAMS